MTADRSKEIFQQSQRSIYEHTDKMFAVLMILQWLGGIAAALFISPRTWAGAESQIHFHVWLAVLLGGAISIFPVCLAIWRPGHTYTRFAVASGQMLMSTLLIHLTGGRIETHFHVFGSLAFLSMYRDWRVFIPATVIVAVDHLLRGLFWPQSVYGIVTAESWRWLEHAGWVLFENIFLFIAIRRSVNEMRDSAKHIAEIEDLNQTLEQRVLERTDQLTEANANLEREVTHRRKAEEELEVFNEKLQQSNRELQDFAYIASHDLQEPLRKVQAFSDRLKTKYGKELEGDGLDYLDRMQSAASRMRNLIQDLLTFSRVTSKAQPFVEVDLGKVTREVLCDLEVKIEETGAVIELSDLPSIEADPLQMRQLMQNLIGNALKFKKDGSVPNVSIRAREPEPNGNGSAKKLQLEVKDNGIGFDEKYTDKIFSVFQRLHGRAEYEGSGVGLAICRKIAERHNGSILAKSYPGEGATFTVTLPHKQSSNGTNHELQ